MKNMLFLLVFIFAVNPSFGQALAENYTSELGVDGYFSAGNQGGNFSLGLMYGVLKKAEDSKVIVGPSLRWMRTWSKNIGTGFEPINFNIIGLGAFVHYRVIDGLYLGAEFESMKSPLNYIFVTPQRQWVPILFVGGGYSKLFDAGFRINIGVFYDLINNNNSPYRRSYLTQKTLQNGQPGALIPILYRLQLVFPL